MQDETGRQAGEALDADLIAEMIESCGVELIAELTEALRADAEADFAALASAARRGDGAAEEAARALHRLRGAALNLGCVGFAAAVERHEAAAKAGRAPDAESVMRLARLLETALAAVEGLKSHLAA